jgi:hypothetical protein
MSALLIMPEYGQHDHSDPAGRHPGNAHPALFGRVVRGQDVVFVLLGVTAGTIVS